ncbi:hypothetical protein SAMN06295905_1331 [Devosia lucknowensis]|uniref:Uncharacterized protein n=1 Tax=Devosia lucknowensis TaxID=1096929 RepID=A0A1Y6EU70_9HYPH|nr:hypothetical protein [Devosia lucknowensis]SMQ65846.1 hypothetical protein SAMN06295905_1331 [Devosia lucknowensis]
MALTEPLDLLTGFPGWSQPFELMARQEQSRHASGRTRVKDFGTPLWHGSWSTKTLSANALDQWRARIEQAMVSQMTFVAWQSSRCRPIMHPGSSSLPTGELHSIGNDDKTVRIADLVGIQLSVGDMLRIGNGLYRAAEQAAGNPTPYFTVSPHLWPGTVTGQDVIIERPWCLMTVDPGSLSTSADIRTGRGTLSFTATEAR